MPPDQAKPTAAPEPIISVRGLVRSFGGRRVLDGVNLDVLPGEVLVILGGSGSGKSTLLRHMIRSFQPDAGEVWMFGQNLCSLAEDDLNKIRRRFGVLFQSGALFNSMTVGENVALPLREHTAQSESVIWIQVKMKLELVGLREHADKFPSEISGGMKKRAGLARALALDPKILFYDEPSAGLDPVTSAEIDQLMVSLTRRLGVTSVVVTHEMDSAFAIADRMAMLDHGKMLCIKPRSYYDRLRRTVPADAQSLDAKERLIRQFLRGDTEGPITSRRATLGPSLAEDLLGPHPPNL